MSRGWGGAKLSPVSVYSFCENLTGLDNPVHVRGDMSRETVEALGDTLCISRRSLLFFLTSWTKDDLLIRLQAETKVESM